MCAAQPALAARTLPACAPPCYLTPPLTIWLHLPVLHPPPSLIPPPPAGGGLGSHGANAIKGCRDQLSSCTQLYVEDQLAAHFPALVEYVKKAEQQNKRMAVPEGAPIPGGCGGPCWAHMWTAGVGEGHEPV